jgi:precorrin-8X/cobalt-precorrin-8 methylmutase
VTRAVPAIEAESFRILRTLIDTSTLPPLTRSVTERIVHATADPAYASDLVCDEQALAAGCAALAAGAPVVVDVRMVAAGIHRPALPGPVICLLDDPRTAPAAARDGITRAAAAFRLAAGNVGPGAVWAVGNAPTALFELLRLDVRPALVIGLPVGFVGAAEAKQALRDSGLPALTNHSPKGGSTLAVAAVNALLYADDPPATGAAPTGPTGDPTRSGYAR